MKFPVSASEPKRPRGLSSIEHYLRPESCFLSFDSGEVLSDAPGRSLLNVPLPSGAVPLSASVPLMPDRLVLTPMPTSAPPTDPPIETPPPAPALDRSCHCRP